MRHLYRTNAREWFVINCKGIVKGMKDYATKKLIESHISVEHGYKEVQTPFLVSWRYKNWNNISGDAFILLSDLKLPAGLIQISRHTNLKKHNTVNFTYFFPNSLEKLLP